MKEEKEDQQSRGEAGTAGSEGPGSPHPLQQGLPPEAGGSHLHSSLHGHLLPPIFTYFTVFKICLLGQCACYLFSNTC